MTPTMTPSRPSAADVGIREVADATGLSVDTLRWYERQGLLPDIDRGADGRRRYTAASVTFVHLVQALRRTGMPVSQVREFVALAGEGAASHGRRMAMLLDQRTAVQAHLAQVRADLVTVGDGLTVGALGYGAMGLAGVYGAADDTESLATLDHVLDSGITLIDTADMYGEGSNERLIAQLLARRRDDVVLATKFGIVGNATDGMSTRGDAAYVRQACDASLARLGIDTIDLYYLHRRQVSVPLAETVGAMAELVAAGKVRHLGLSEVTADELRQAQAITPIAAVQSEWSLWSRDVEAAVVPTAAELGVGFVPYSPLGRGFLTGTLADPASFAGDWRSGLSRFSGSAHDRNLAVVTAVQGVATEVDATPAQVALAWLWAAGRQYGLPVVPIPGTRRAARIDENLGALQVELTTEQLALLDTLATQVVGARSDNADPDWVSDTR